MRLIGVMSMNNVNLGKLQDQRLPMLPISSWCIMYPCELILCYFPTTIEQFSPLWRYFSTPKITSANEIPLRIQSLRYLNSRAHIVWNSVINSINLHWICLVFGTYVERAQITDAILNGIRCENNWINPDKESDAVIHCRFTFLFHDGFCGLCAIDSFTSVIYASSQAAVGSRLALCRPANKARIEYSSWNVKGDNER